VRGTTHFEDPQEEAGVSLDDIIVHIPAFRRIHPIPSVLDGIASPARNIEECQAVV
jgi:hypothetical protein